MRNKYCSYNKTWPGWLGIFCTLRKLVIGPQLCRVFNMSHVATIIIPGKFSMSQLCCYDQSKMKSGQNYHSLIPLHLQLRCGGKLNDIWIWKTIFQPFSDRRAGTDRHCDQNREKWCCWTFENLRIRKFVKRVNGDESLPYFGWLTFNELRCASAANSTLIWKHEGLWALFSFYELWMKYDIDSMQIVKKR